MTGGVTGLIAYMVAMTGWTWHEVRDQLDMPRVEALQTAWKDNPPLAVTMRVAAEALGVEFKGSSLTKPQDRAGSDDFNPMGMMADLGQAEPFRYVAPAKGLPIAPQG